MSAKAAIRSTSTEATGFQATEIGLIPSDWEVVSAGDLGRFRGGNGFPVSYQGRSEGQFPFFKVSDMNIAGNEIWMVSANNYLSERDRQRLGSYVFPRETIIFAKVGAAIFLERKKLLNSPSCIDNNMAGFMVESSQIDRNYIYHQFVNYRLSGLVSTTALPSLNGAVLKSIKFAKPKTLIEQKYIANALSDADTLIESLERLIAKKRAIKQGAMTDLLSGKRRLAGFSGQWDAKTLGSLCEVVNGLTYSPSDTREDGVLVLRSSNIQNDILSFENNVFVNMNVPNKCFVEENDILICVRNGSRDLIGKCVKIDKRCEGMAFGAFMAILRTPLHDYILHQFRSDNMKKQIAERMGATINQITNSSFKSFSVPVPPTKDEADAIAKVLSDLDEEIDALVGRLAKARQIKQGMMQELLTGRTRLL